MDRLEDKAKRAKGKIEEVVGTATDNEELENKGRRDQAKGAVEEAGHSIKDAAEQVKDSMIK